MDPVRTEHINSHTNAPRHCVITSPSSKYKSNAKLSNFITITCITFTTVCFVQKKVQQKRSV